MIENRIPCFVICKIFIVFLQKHSTFRPIRVFIRNGSTRSLQQVIASPRDLSEGITSCTGDNSVITQDWEYGMNRLKKHVKQTSIIYNIIISLYKIKYKTNSQ